MKAKLFPVSIILLVALVLLGGVWFFLNHSKTQGKPTALSADEILANMVETDSITTNLYSGGYIQLRFQIQTSSKEAKEELEKRSFQVQDMILRLASGMTADEAKRPEGNAQFENQMKIRLNQLLQSGKVVQVFTINKVVQ
jgi:flagellar protein FliL